MFLLKQKQWTLWLKWRRHASKMSQVSLYLGHTISNEDCHQSAFNHPAHLLSSWEMERTKNRTYWPSNKAVFAAVLPTLSKPVIFNVSQLSKFESTWMNFLRKPLRNRFQRVNVSRSRRRINRSHRNPQRNQSTIGDDDLDWCFKLTNMNIFQLTCSGPIRTFSHIQYLKSISPHYQTSKHKKKVMFRTNKKLYAQGPWKNYLAITGLSKIQLQKEMQDKTRFLLMVEMILGTQPAATVDGEQRWWWWSIVNHQQGTNISVTLIFV